MIAFLCLLIGVAIGCVIGRGTAPRLAGDPVVLFESEEYRSKYIERQRDLRASLHRMRSS